MKDGKNISCWIGRSDLIGDAVMSLPMFSYFEKLYPGSYKIFPLMRKCLQAAPLLINHPLIDRIHISEHDEDFGGYDKSVFEKCDIKLNTRPSHQIDDWYNYFDCVPETIRMAGIDLDHFNSTLSEQERYPRLYRYFDTGLFNPNSFGYCVKDERVKSSKNIAIQPFCGYGKGLERSPDKGFWSKLVKKLIDAGYEVSHYGFVNEPVLSYDVRYSKLTDLSFFDQVKAALASKCLISGDSGFSWVTGAYSHKSIYLITNWQRNHYQNLFAFLYI